MPVDLDQLATAVGSHAADSHTLAARLAREALAAGVSAGRILEEGLVRGMADVGIRFREGLIFVPEVLVSARAMKAALEILRPALAAGGHMPLGRCVIGTVQGDVHDIGKNLVGMMLQGAGFEVIDIGTDVSLARFDAAIAAHRPDIVAMSALLTTTMPAMQRNLLAWGGRPGGRAFKVMVGGAPVTGAWAASIGADAWAGDAATAAEVAARLVQPARGAVRG